MDSQTHRQIARQTQLARNAAARRTRASRAGRSADVVVIDGTGSDGNAYRLALSVKDPTRAYVLTETSGGAWRCTCPVYTWRSTCAHAEAAGNATRAA